MYFYHPYIYFNRVKNVKSKDKKQILLWFINSF